MNKPLEPIIKDNRCQKNDFTNWVLCIWYYCPKCKSFQYPKKDDLNGTIAECPYCKQQIDYRRYIKEEVKDE